MQYLNGLIEIYMCACLLSHSVMSDSETLWIAPSRLLCPWDPPGKNTGVGCHALLQGLFLTQGLNPCLLHCRRIFLPSEPPGKPWCQHRFLKATSEEARGWTQCLIASHVDKSMLFTWAHISFRSFVTYGQERGPSNFPLRSRFPFCWRNHLAS